MTDFRKALMLAPILSDGAGIFPEDEASASTAATNLLTPRPRKAWVTEQLPTVSFDLNLFAGAAAVEHNAYLVAFCNAGDADTLKVELATTQAGLSSPAVTYSGITPMARRLSRAWRHFLYFAGDAVANTHAWARFTFSIADPILPTGYAGADYFQAGRLMVGKAFRPEQNITFDYQLLPNLQRVSSVKTWTGEEVSEDRGKSRGARFRMGWLTDDEAGTVDDTEWALGRSKDVCAVLDMDLTGADLDRNTFVGRVTPSPLSAGAGGKASGRWSKSWDITQEVAY